MKKSTLKDKIGTIAYMLRPTRRKMYLACGLGLLTAIVGTTNFLTELSNLEVDMHLSSGVDNIIYGDGASRLPEKGIGFNFRPLVYGGLGALVAFGSAVALKVESYTGASFFQKERNLPSFADKDAIRRREYR